MSEFIERGGRAVYEADPVRDPPKFEQPISWEGLLETTRQTSRAQFKAALAVAAEWFDANGATCAGLTPAAAIRQQIELPKHGS